MKSTFIMCFLFLALISSEVRASSASLNVSATVLQFLKVNMESNCEVSDDIVNLYLRIRFKTNAETNVSLQVDSQLENELYFKNNEQLQIGTPYLLGKTSHGNGDITASLMIRNAPDNFCTVRKNIFIIIE